MTSWECYENKWFYMKYIGKYLSGEILFTRECIILMIYNKNFIGLKSTFLNIYWYLNLLKTYFFNENVILSITCIIYQLKTNSLKIGLISISLNNGNVIDISVIKIVH